MENTVYRMAFPSTVAYSIFAHCEHPCREPHTHTIVSRRVGFGVREKYPPAKRGRTVPAARFLMIRNTRTERVVAAPLITPIQMRVQWSGRMQRPHKMEVKQEHEHDGTENLKASKNTTKHQEIGELDRIGEIKRRKNISQTGNDFSFYVCPTTKKLSLRHRHSTFSSPAKGRWE